MQTRWDFTACHVEKTVSIRIGAKNITFDSFCIYGFFQTLAQ